MSPRWQVLETRSDFQAVSMRDDRGFISRSEAVVIVAKILVRDGDVEALVDTVNAFDRDAGNAAEMIAGLRSFVEAEKRAHLATTEELARVRAELREAMEENEQLIQCAYAAQVFVDAEDMRGARPTLESQLLGEALSRLGFEVPVDEEGCRDADGNSWATHFFGYEKCLRCGWKGDRATTSKPKRPAQGFITDDMIRSAALDFAKMGAEFEASISKAILGTAVGDVKAGDLVSAQLPPRTAFDTLTINGVPALMETRVEIECEVCRRKTGQVMVFPASASPGSIKMQTAGGRCTGCAADPSINLRDEASLRAAFVAAWGSPDGVIQQRTQAIAQPAPKPQPPPPKPKPAGRFAVISETLENEERAACIRAEIEARAASMEAEADGAPYEFSNDDIPF